MNIVKGFHKETESLCKSEDYPITMRLISWIVRNDLDGDRYVWDNLIAPIKELEYQVNKQRNGENKMNKNELIEALAEFAHEQWSGWMKYLFDKSEYKFNGSVTIPADLVSRWGRQMSARYKNLPEEEKESDRIEARRMMEIMERRK